jgi:hypothetical protein
MTQKEEREQLFLPLFFQKKPMGKAGRKASKPFFYGKNMGFTFLRDPGGGCVEGVGERVHVLF